jgi:hypothetical protein
MTVTNLRKEYFQKSRIFLYPMLEIKKGSTILPEETYIAWEEVIKPEDRKLICLYDIEKNPTFKAFEKVKLFGNKKFDNFMEDNQDKGIYIFTMEDIKDDYDLFINGKYSLTSESFKNKILNYYGENSSSYEIIMSYLYPEKYFETYAKLLNVDVNLLKEVGELCAPITLKQETLSLKTEDLKIPDIII